MIVPDTNILLYAHIPSFDEHLAARAWLEDALNNGQEIIGLTWQVITSYIRIATNPKIFVSALSATVAGRHITELIDCPLGQFVLPESKHWEIFLDLIEKEQVTGNLVMDAHLAAIGIEQNARIATTDRDFARFRGLQYFNPLVR